MSGLREAVLAGVAGAAVTAALLLGLTPRNEAGLALAALTVIVMAAAVLRLRRVPTDDPSSTERSMWQ